MSTFDKELDRFFRFVAGLDLRTLSIADQRQWRERVHAMRREIDARRKAGEPASVAKGHAQLKDAKFHILDTDLAALREIRAPVYFTTKASCMTIDKIDVSANLDAILSLCGDAPRYPGETDDQVRARMEAM